MASEIGICNQAILEVAGQPITSLLDDSLEARVCNSVYTASRDFVLEQREWSFSIKRAVLAKSTAAPAFGYTNRFKLPADCLRVLECWDSVDSDQPNPLQWEKEGEYVLSNSDVIYLKYVSQVTDPNQFSAGYSKALVFYLASRLAIPVQNSKSLQEEKFSIYKDSLYDGAAVDGMQGRTRRVLSSRLINARHR